MKENNEAILKILETEPLSKCLRRASYLAGELSEEGLRRWLLLELGGYVESNPVMKDEIVVPKYRRVVGQHTDVYGRVLVVPADIAYVNEIPVRSGVEELEAMAANQGILTIHDPRMCDLIRTHLEVEVHFFRFSPIPIKGILSAIRTQLETKLHGLSIPIRIQPPPESRRDEVIELRPNIYGLGINLRELWRRLTGSTKGPRGDESA